MHHQSLFKAKEEVAAVDLCPDCLVVVAVDRLVSLRPEDVVVVLVLVLLVMFLGSDAPEHRQSSSMPIHAGHVHVHVLVATLSVVVNDHRHSSSTPIHADHVHVRLLVGTLPVVVNDHAPHLSSSPEAIAIGIGLGLGHPTDSNAVQGPLPGESSRLADGTVDRVLGQGLPDEDHIHHVEVTLTPQGQRGLIPQEGTIMNLTTMLR